MVIYNVGLPRTGTRSLTLYLYSRGLKFKHPNFTNNYDFSIENVLKNKTQWIEENRFYANTPIWHPEFWGIVDTDKHKIIHTYRDIDSWIFSMKSYDYFSSKLMNRDKYWFYSYFGGFDEENLRNVYHKHLNDVKRLNGVLDININDDNVLNTQKICEFIGLDYDENLIIGHEK